MTKEKNSTKPVQQFCLRGITLSVFANSAKDRDVKFYKVSMKKTYKDGADFKTTTSLGRDDLPVADLLMKKAWVWILERESEDRKETSDDK